MKSHTIKEKFRTKEPAAPGKNETDLEEVFYASSADDQ
jgi:hypothetical protein